MERTLTAIKEPAVDDPVIDLADTIRIPGYVTGSLVATIHRRAAEAALLRDRRLELDIDDQGELRMRMVQRSARIA